MRFLSLIVIFLCGAWLLLPIQKNIYMNYPQHQQSVKENLINRYNFFSKLMCFPTLALVVSKIFPIKHGLYEFKKGTHYYQVFNILWYGSNQHMCKITIPEGWSSEKIFAYIRDDTSLSGPMPEFVANGYLWPSTYYYVNGTSRKKIIEMMKKECEKVHNLLWSQKSVWKSKQDWIIFASMIEKEGVDYDDKRQIANALWSRLQKKMRLQVDATVAYIKTSGMYNRIISRKDWWIQSPYNTYRNRGLPIAAITNPSETSLMVSLQPTITDKIYYKVISAGKHYFSSSLKEHIFA